MQIRRAALRLGGLYASASPSRKREAVMSTTAQKKLEALEFWRKHGLDATRDAFAVSRSNPVRLAREAPRGRAAGAAGPQGGGGTWVWQTRLGG